METGFYEEDLLHWRTRVGLMYYDQLSENDKTALNDSCFWPGTISGMLQRLQCINMNKRDCLILC